MNKHLICLAFAAIAALTGAVSAGTYSGGGSGTAEKPYRISTAEDMNAIGAHPNDWDSHFIMVNDINLAGYIGTEFNIIGYYIRLPLHASIEVPFSGVFDGNDNAIYSFTYSSNERDNVGLFGFVDGVNAEIRNLTLIAPDVNAATRSDAGPLIGVLDAGHVLNCKVEGGSIYGRGSIGGLVGHVISPSGRITNCSSSSVVSGDDGIGGLVGNNTAMLTPGGGGIITKCFASGAVNGDNSVGGLVGSNCWLISDCYATGNVNGISGVGGLVGLNYESWATISRSYSTGSIEGHNSTGGLVGWNYGGTLSDCYAVGDVDGINSTGGLVGSNNLSIMLSNMISNCYATGDVNGISDTGALVGYDGSNALISCFYINCFWDRDVNPDVNGIGNASDPNVIGESTVNMQTESTFTDAGWDFVTPIWKICEDNDYPRLWWEECPEPIEAELLIFPRVIVHHSRGKNILAWIRLPEGVAKEQISDEPIQLWPGEIEAANQYVIEHGRRGHKRTSVLAFFKKAGLMGAVADNGEVEVEAVGSLTSGRYFYGSDTVWIKARPNRPSRRWRFN